MASKDAISIKFELRGHLRRLSVPLGTTLVAVSQQISALVKIPSANLSIKYQDASGNWRLIQTNDDIQAAFSAVPRGADGKPVPLRLAVEERGLQTEGVSTPKGNQQPPSPLNIPPTPQAGQKPGTPINNASTNNNAANTPSSTTGNNGSKNASAPSPVLSARSQPAGGPVLLPLVDASGTLLPAKSASNNNPSSAAVISSPKPPLPPKQPSIPILDLTAKSNPGTGETKLGNASATVASQSPRLATILTSQPQPLISLQQQQTPVAMNPARASLDISDSKRIGSSALPSPSTSVSLSASQSVSALPMPEVGCCRCPNCPCKGVDARLCTQACTGCSVSVSAQPVQQGTASITISSQPILPLIQSQISTTNARLPPNEPTGSTLCPTDMSPSQVSVQAQGETPLSVAVAPVTPLKQQISGNNNSKALQRQQQSASASKKAKDLVTLVSVLKKSAIELKTMTKSLRHTFRRVLPRHKDKDGQHRHNHRQSASVTGVSAEGRRVAASHDLLGSKDADRMGQILRLAKSLPVAPESQHNSDNSTPGELKPRVKEADVRGEHKRKSKRSAATASLDDQDLVGLDALTSPDTVLNTLANLDLNDLKGLAFGDTSDTDGAATALDKDEQPPAQHSGLVSRQSSSEVEGKVKDRSSKPTNASTATVIAVASLPVVSEKTEQPGIAVATVPKTSADNSAQRVGMRRNRSFSDPDRGSGFEYGADEYSGNEDPDADSSSLSGDERDRVNLSSGDHSSSEDDTENTGPGSVQGTVGSTAGSKSSKHSNSNNNNRGRSKNSGKSKDRHLSNSERLRRKERERRRRSKARSNGVGAGSQSVVKESKDKEARDEDMSKLEASLANLAPANTEALQKLNAMGFPNPEFSALLLQMNNNDLDKTIKELQRFHKVTAAGESEGAVSKPVTATSTAK